MNEPTNSIRIALRIPGQWSHPRELIERLPENIHVSPNGMLVLADQTEIELSGLPADEQFAQIFRQSCRQPAEVNELAIVDGYKVNVCLSGPGGSLDAAQKMMDAGAAIVRAGGAGVFIDNSALAHGGQNWIAMTEDGSSDALSFAFTAVISGQSEAYTMGMHALGLRDIVMKRADAEQDDFGIVEVIRYMARSEKPIDDGHLLADLDCPRFQAIAEASDSSLKGSVMYNPFGRLKLVSMRDLAERN